MIGVGNACWPADGTTALGHGYGARPGDRGQSSRNTGLLEATVALSALAFEPERWESVLRRLDA